MGYVLPTDLEGVPPELPGPPPVLDPIVKTEVPPFFQSPGTLCGRVEEDDGSAIFVLGDLQNLRVEEFASGDFIQVQQEVDVTKIDKISTHVSVPSSEGADGWGVELRVGVAIFDSKDMPRRVQSTWLDLVAPVTQESGVKTVAVRLVRR